MSAVEPRWLWDFVRREADKPASVLIEARDASADPGAVEGTTLFVASTDTPDRAMDVVSQNWKLASFRDNPVILDNHDPRRVVGHAVEAKVPRVGDDAGKLMIRVAWDMDSPDPSIRNVGHQHMRGIRRAGSVGFRAGKSTQRSKLPPDHPYYQAPIEVETWWGTEMVSGTLFEAPELLEFSSATIPMNSEALQRSILCGVPRGTLRADPPADVPAETPNAPEFLAQLADDGVRGQLMDLIWPDAVARMLLMLSPAETEADTAEETPAAKALRAAVHRILREPASRRILRAAIDAEPPPATPSLASLVIAALEST